MMGRIPSSAEIELSKAIVAMELEIKHTLETVIKPHKQHEENKPMDRRTAEWIVKNKASGNSGVLRGYLERCEQEKELLEFCAKVATGACPACDDAPELLDGHEICICRELYRSLVLEMSKKLQKLNGGESK